MKKLKEIEFILLIALVLFSFMLASFGYMAYHKVEKLSDIEYNEVVSIPVEIEVEVLEKIPNLNSFLDDLVTENQVIDMML